MGLPFAFWQTPSSFTASTASFILNGVNEYISVPATTNLSFTDGVSDKPFTISIWINTSDLRNGRLIKKDSEYLIAGNSTTQWYMRILTNSTNYVSVRMTTGHAAGQWQHIVFTYDGTYTLNGITSFQNYTDSVMLASGFAGSAGTYTGMVASSDIVQIGDTMTSNISYISIYDKQLSQSEVIELYSGGALFNISSSSFIGSCISWWRNDQTDNVTIPNGVIDQVGSNNGTAQNMDISNIDNGNIPT